MDGLFSLELLPGVVDGSPGKHDEGLAQARPWTAYDFTPNTSERTGSSQASEANQLKDELLHDSCGCRY